MSGAYDAVHNLKMIKLQLDMVRQIKYRYEMNPQEQLRHAQEELLKLEQQKIAIERQMRGWIRIVEGLRMIIERPSPSGHLTGEVVRSLPDKILAVLENVSSPIGATQIRDQLIASRAVHVPSPKNLLINIHTTLKRLVQAEKVEEVPLEDGSKLYAYASPLRRAMNLVSLSSLLSADIEDPRKDGPFSSLLGPEVRDPKGDVSLSSSLGEDVGTAPKRKK